MGTRNSKTSQKATGRRSTSQTFPRRASKTIRAAIDDFLLDSESRNFSPKTLVQHRTSLAHLANFAVGALRDGRLLIAEAGQRHIFCTDSAIHPLV